MLKFDSEIDKLSALKSIRSAGISAVLISVTYAFLTINAIITSNIAFTFSNIFDVLLTFFLFFLSYRIFLGERVAIITFFVIFLTLVLIAVYFTDERTGLIGFMYRCMLGYFLLKGVEAVFWLKKQALTPHSSGTPNGAP